METTFTGTIFENVGILIPDLTVEQKRELIQSLLIAYMGNDVDINCDSNAADYVDIVTELARVFMDSCCMSALNCVKDRLEIYEVDDYLRHRKPDTPYFCVICQDHKEGGVELSCSNGTHCVFCESCIITWLTTVSARCPYCRQHLGCKAN